MSDDRLTAIVATALKTGQAVDIIRAVWNTADAQARSEIRESMTRLFAADWIDQHQKLKAAKAERAKKRADVFAKRKAKAAVSH